MGTTQKGMMIPIIAAVTIVLLGLGGYYYVRSNKNPTDDAVSAGTEVTVKGDMSMGIVVTSPKANEIVKMPIIITGSINGKNWFGNEGEVGTAQVFDAKGRSISNIEVLMATTDWLKFPTEFQAIVGDREMMAYITTDNGMVRITGSGAKDGDTPPVLEIPVRFK